MPASAIEVVDLTRRYGSFTALHHLSFSVRPGEVVALLGANGAGKTTVLRVLSGFLAPSTGKACVGGFETIANRLAAALCVGYLPEHGPLYLDMTPSELLRFFAAARHVPAAARAERLEAVMSRCRLHDVANRPIGTLSKGFRQRVGLAQALIHDPPVLLLDEPTAGLDPVQVGHFRQTVHDLRREKTLLLSTHILHEVESVADRVVMLHRGTVAFDGDVEAMKDGGSLEEAFHRLTVEAERRL